MINPKTRLFVILWLAGMAGVLSLLFIDLSAILASLPASAGSEMPFDPRLIKLISLVQPTIILSVAVFIGVQFASQIGLSAPAAEALATGKSVAPRLKRQIVPGLIAGFAGGVGIIASWVLSRPLLPPLFVSRAEKLNSSVPFLTRLLYGGITEELLLRWGLLTLLVWLAWRVFQKGQGKPRPIYLAGAIVISSIVFGIGHLPLVAALQVDFTPPIVAFVIIVNSFFGLIAGYLYWKKGLEAAIIAHMSAHVVIVTAMRLAG